MAHTNSNPTDGSTNGVSMNDPCPSCGELFGRKEGGGSFGEVPDKTSGDATIARSSDGQLMVAVEFPCPNCGQDLLVEDLMDGVMYAE